MASVGESKGAHGDPPAEATHPTAGHVTGADGADGVVEAGAGGEGVEKRVLSIQSHVVFGYVGNKSAVFPLQLRGFDVCAINSVQFSNHTGYPSFKGKVLHGEELKELVRGLADNDLMAYSHILTGYIGSATFLEAVVGVVEAARKENPGLTYVCDPVLGDHGKLYVPESLVELYRSKILGIASIVTPNQFELEMLSGRKVEDMASMLEACNVLHERGVEVVIVTSAQFKADGDLVMVASVPWEAVSDTKGLWGSKAGATKYARFALPIPILPEAFTGTGDLTAAMILAFTDEYPRAYTTAIECALAAVQAVCVRTVNAPGKPPKKELKLVQSKADLEHPTVRIRAEPL